MLLLLLILLLLLSLLLGAKVAGILNAILNKLHQNFPFESMIAIYEKLNCKEELCPPSLLLTLNGCQRGKTLATVSYCYTALHLISSVIRKNGESKYGCFKKAKHAKFFKKRTFLTPQYAQSR